MIQDLLKLGLGAGVVVAVGIAVIVVVDPVVAGLNGTHKNTGIRIVTFWKQP
mgnify:CR=1 FL=1